MFSYIKKKYMGTINFCSKERYLPNIIIKKNVDFDLHFLKLKLNNAEENNRSYLIHIIKYLFLLHKTMYNDNKYFYYTRRRIMTINIFIIQEYV